MVNGSRITCLDTEVMTPDGVRLATDVFLPDDGGRHPTLLFRTPYGRGGGRGAYDPIAMARLGWAVVIQDVRGRWESGGEFVPFGNEAADGAHTIAWSTSQPWSDGTVAMAGASYLGFVQWLAASQKPAGLVAIAPAVSTPNIRDEAIFEGGALAAGTFSAWGLGIGALGSNLDVELIGSSLQALDRWPDILDHPIEDSLLARISPGGIGWLRADTDEFWDRLDLSTRLPELDVAGYHLAGWHDIFCEGNLRAYAALAGRDDNARRRHRLVVGPWAHATMLRRTTGQLDFGIHAAGDFNGVPDEQIAFLTEAVAGRDVPSGVRLFVMGDNQWREFPTWPVPSTPTPLYLTTDFELSHSAPADGDAHRFRHDPATPVPTAGGRSLHPIPPQAGPRDQRDIEARSDVLVYTGEPLERDVTIIGTLHAQLTFASTSPVTDVAVKLVDVHPDGRAMLVVDSVRRVALRPGEPAEVDVGVGSTALTFKPGHRIRIEVASSNYPKYERGPRADQTVHTGGPSPSKVVLPIHG